MILQTLSLEALYYDLMSTVSAGRVTKDNTISSDLVKSWIIDKRYKYISQQLSKNKKLETTFIQNLGCVEMTPVDASLCCSVELGCTFLRSVLPMPQFIQISRIGDINNQGTNWSIIPYERIPLEKYSPKYSLKRPKFYIKDFDNYLYCYYSKEQNPESGYLTNVNVHGVLVDPRAAAPFTNCNTGSSCYSDNDQFPMTMRLWEMVKQDIISTELRIAMITDMDEHNNSKGDAEVNNLRKLNVQKAQD